MSESTADKMAEKWDRRYRDADSPGEPSFVLEHNRHLLPATGDALDLASGLGANALLLARHGLNTKAWDVSAVALAKLTAFAAAEGLAVTTEQRDVEARPPLPVSFDVIVVSHFLHRPICEALTTALRPGGLLFYQTFTRRKLSDAGPSSDGFLLAPNELLRHFSALEIRYYREDDRDGDLAQGRRDCAYFVGQKRR